MCRSLSDTVKSDTHVEQVSLPLSSSALNALLGTGWTETRSILEQGQV